LGKSSSAAGDLLARDESFGEPELAA
jgi:hypothetical protein